LYQVGSGLRVVRAIQTQLKADILVGLLTDGVVDHSYVDDTMVDERGMLVTPPFRKGYGHGITAKVMIMFPRSPSLATKTNRSYSKVAASSTWRPRNNSPHTHPR